MCNRTNQAIIIGDGASFLGDENISWMDEGSGYVEVGDDAIYVLQVPRGCKIKTENCEFIS